MKSQAQKITPDATATIAATTMSTTRHLTLGLRTAEDWFSSVIKVCAFLLCKGTGSRRDVRAPALSGIRSYG